MFLRAEGPGKEQPTAGVCLFSDPWTGEHRVPWLQCEKYIFNFFFFDYRTNLPAQEWNNSNGGQLCNGPPADVSQITLKIERVRHKEQILGLRSSRARPLKPTVYKKQNWSLKRDPGSSEMDYFQVFEKLQTAVGRKKTLTGCDKAEQERHENKFPHETEKALRLWQPAGDGWCRLGRRSLLSNVWGKSSFTVPDRAKPPRRPPRNEHSHRRCFGGSGKHRTHPRGHQRQPSSYQRATSKPQLPTAAPGLPEDADVQAEGRIWIQSCKVKGFKNCEASGRASLHTACYCCRGSGHCCSTTSSSVRSRYRTGLATAW